MGHYKNEYFVFELPKISFGLPESRIKYCKLFFSHFDNTTSFIFLTSNNFERFFLTN